MMDLVSDILLLLLSVSLFVLALCGATENGNRMSYEQGVKTRSELSLTVEGCQKHVQLVNAGSEGYWLAGCYDAIPK